MSLLTISRIPDLGMGVSLLARLIGSSVSTAADGCDVSVLFLAVRNQGLLVTA